VHVLEEADLGEAVERELRWGLAQRPANGSADEAVAASCFAHGLVDLGLTFSLRSAGAYRAQGDGTSVSRVLAAAATHTAKMTPRALAALARARARAGQLGAAADLVGVAAERARNEGSVEQALECCLAAARWYPQVRGIHRTWTLCLLASGDPDGALGHLLRWGRETGAQWDKVRLELEAACGAIRAGELIARARRLAEGPGAAAAPLSQTRSRAFLAPGLAARREQLVRVLAEADIDVVEASCQGGVAEALVGALPLDLLILPIGPNRCPRADWLRELQAQSGLEGLPILGALVGELDVDQLEALRALGLAGVLDPGANAEHIKFRVERVLRRQGPERRVHTRIPVSLEVAVDAGGALTSERADSLSSGGLRLRSTRSLDLNQEVRLRFRPEPDMASIRANARVVNCIPAPSGESGHAIGVFFLDLTASDRARLDALVARRLASGDARRTQSGSENVRPEGEPR
jgi:DNA-binding response OmpR family regulator